MSAVAGELREVLGELAGRARTDRLPGWSARIGIVVGAEAWVTCAIDADGLRVTDGLTDASTTFTVASPEALRRWLLDGVDYTHLVRSGDITIDGVYFDVLLLSKALGLRPDRKIGDAR